MRRATLFSLSLTVLIAAALFGQVCFAQDGVLVPQWRAHGVASRLVFSPDGSKLAAGVNEGALVLFDAKAGLMLGSQVGLPDTPVMVAWSPDGTRLYSLFSAGSQSMLMLHDVATGARTQEATLNLPVASASPTADGLRLLVVESGSGREAVWYSTQTLSRGVTVNPPDNFSLTVGGVSPDGTRFVLGDETGTVALYKMDSKLEKTFDCTADGAVTLLAFSANGKYLACADSTDHVQVFLLGAKPTLHLSVQADKRVVSVAIPDDGNGLFVGAEGTGGYYDMKGNIEFPYTDPGNEYQPSAHAVALAKDGAIAVGLANDDIAILQDKEGKALRKLGDTTWTGLLGRIADAGNVAYFLNGLGGSSGALNLATGALLPKLASDEEYFPEGFFLAPDGKSVITRDHLQEFRQYDLAKGKVMAEPNGGTWVMAMSPDGKWVLWADDENERMALGDTAGTKEASPLGGLPIANSALFSKDGKTLWLAFEDGKVLGLDPASRVETTQMLSAAAVACLAEAPDAQHLILADRTDTVYLAGFGSEEPKKLFQMWAAVIHMVLSPDGKRLLARDGGGTVLLWDMAAQAEVWRIDLDGVCVEDVGFTANGARALIATDDGVVRYVDVLNGVTVAVAKFFEEGGWFIGTSAGFFDCSKGMERHYAIRCEGVLKPLKELENQYKDGKKVQAVLEGR